MMTVVPVGDLSVITRILPTPTIFIAVLMPRTIAIPVICETPFTGTAMAVAETVLSDAIHLFYVRAGEESTILLDYRYPVKLAPDLEGVRIFRRRKDKACSYMKVQRKDV